MAAMLVTQTIQGKMYFFYTLPPDDILLRQKEVLLNLLVSEIQFLITGVDFDCKITRERHKHTLYFCFDRTVVLFFLFFLPL